MSENSNTPPFVVGQRVIALKDSGDIDFYKKGQEYIIAGLKYCCAKSGWRVAINDVSLTDGGVAKCLSCKRILGDKLLFPAKNFAPIQTQYADMTAEIAASVKQTDEVPDKILIPEIAN